MKEGIRRRSPSKKCKIKVKKKNGDLKYKCQQTKLVGKRKTQKGEEILDEVIILNFPKRMKYINYKRI